MIWGGTTVSGLGEKFPKMAKKKISWCWCSIGLRHLRGCVTPPSIRSCALRLPLPPENCGSYVRMLCGRSSTAMCLDISRQSHSCLLAWLPGPASLAACEQQASIDSATVDKLPRTAATNKCDIRRTLVNSEEKSRHRAVAGERLLLIYRDSASFQNKKFDYCNWAFGPEYLPALRIRPVV